MVHLYLMPAWFLGYDITLHLVFAIITLIVSAFAFRIYRLSAQRQPRLFATAFFFISMAYFMSALLNFLLLTRLNENVCIALKVASASALTMIGTYIYLLLFSIGLITLTYMTLRVRSAKIYFLLTITALVSILMSAEPVPLYHLISSVMLVYIIIHYAFDYSNKKKPNAMLMLAAFALLLLGNVHLIFPITGSPAYYVFAHCLELIAYAFILINLILVQRHEKKARQTSNSS
jgi:hypothetical protein